MRTATPEENYALHGNIHGPIKSYWGVSDRASVRLGRERELKYLIQNQQNMLATMRVFARKYRAGREKIAELEMLLASEE